MNFICTLIIFLNLLDHENTSVLVLISVGLSLPIEFWKVCYLCDSLSKRLLS